MVFSFEAAGVQQTTVAGAITEDFNSAALGYHSSYVSPVGTYTPLMVKPADIWGGAGGTGSFADLNGNPVVSTLTLSGPRTYFGMWWSGGDETDLLEFYSGGTLVGSFMVADLIPHLSSGHYDNPNFQWVTTSQPYVYVNFTGTSGTTFDTIVFKETGFGGFETDNHSVYDRPITPPGTVVPEPSTVVAGALLLMPLGMSVIRRFRRS